MMPHNRWFKNSLLCPQKCSVPHATLFHGSEGPASVFELVRRETREWRKEQAEDGSDQWKLHHIPLDKPSLDRLKNSTTCATSVTVLQAVALAGYGKYDGFVGTPTLKQVDPLLQSPLSTG